MSGAVPLPPPPAGRVRAARRHLHREGPPALERLLMLVERHTSPAQAAPLWLAAAVGLHIWNQLHDALESSGRETVTRTFALHAALRDPAPADPHPLGNYTEWLHAAIATDPRWRTMLMQWIDVLTERLTLHRYNRPDHRPHHARTLIAQLLALAGLVETNINPTLLDQLLHAWDLASARELQAYGWNRLTLSDEAPLGGTYGLADQARPADDALILSEARALLEELRSPAVAETPGSLATQLRAELIATLESFLEHGTWPDHAATRPRRGGWRGFLAGLCRRPG